MCSQTRTFKRLRPGLRSKMPILSMQRAYSCCSWDSGFGVFREEGPSLTCNRDSNPSKNITDLFLIYSGTCVRVPRPSLLIWHTRNSADEDDDGEIRSVWQQESCVSIHSKTQKKYIGTVIIAINVHMNARMRAACRHARAAPRNFDASFATPMSFPAGPRAIPAIHE